MTLLRIILTLLISALIGYMTNYIAVRMLFRPLRPVYIGKHRLPFTPGIIPKSKPRLAKALGNAVGDTLLTDEDIQNSLLSEPTVQAVSNQICSSIFALEDGSVKGLAASFCSADDYAAARKKVGSYITAAVLDGARKADIGSVIISEGTTAIKEKVSGTMMGMFVTDELIASMAAPIGEKINDYIDNNGEETISRMVETELCKLENSSLGGLLTSAGLTPDKLSSAVKSIYSKLINEKMSDILKAVNLKKIVEDKVNSMEVSDLEELVMSVMKNELNAIINLGALIGLVIGILNVVIALI